jgi:hypothetical protein
LYIRTRVTLSTAAAAAGRAQELPAPGDSTRAIPSPAQFSSESQVDMEYTVEIEIDLPRDRVIELFDSTENLYKWQRGLLSFEHVSGEPGQTGAQSEMVFQMGKRTIKMLETITLRDLPEKFHSTYDAPGVHNPVENTFDEVSPDKTRWVSHNVFHFRGFMKLIGFFLKGAFPKQSLKYMEDFKAFAEQGVDVRDEAATADQAKPKPS